MHAAKVLALQPIELARQMFVFYEVILTILTYSQPINAGNGYGFYWVSRLSPSHDFPSSRKFTITNSCSIHVLVGEPRVFIISVCVCVCCLARNVYPFTTEHFGIGVDPTGAAGATAASQHKYWGEGQSQGFPPPSPIIFSCTNSWFDASINRQDIER